MFENRNYGIDILKAICMFYVVILHALGRWGLLDPAITGGQQYYAAWFLETLAFCAVDCFALITGYLSYRDGVSKLKLGNIILLWLEIVFYGALNILIKKIFGLSIQENELRLSFCPILSNAYWYFTAYLGLYLFIPIIMNGLRIISDRHSKVILAGIILIFTIMETCTGNFNTASGYSFVWLLILCIGGGIIKKIDLFPKVSSNAKIFIILSCCILSYCLKMNSGILRSDIILSKVFINTVEYISPFMFITAVSYLLLFSKLAIKSEKLKRMAKGMGEGAFAVFVLNNPRFVYDSFLHSIFEVSPVSSVLKIVISLTLCAIVFVLGTFVMDYARRKLFYYIGINRLLCRLDLLLNEQ